MHRRAVRLPLFAFEALGSLACGFYGNYIFFLFRDRHDFGNLGNLTAAALMGLVISVAAWHGGRVAQRRGLTPTMYLGLCGMIGALLMGWCFESLAWQLVVLVVWCASQFIVWPALEALVVDGLNGRSRANMVGIYSVVWASCSAFAYFFGGTIFDQLGGESIFWLPSLIHLLQIAILWNYEKSQKNLCPISVRSEAPVYQATPLYVGGRISPRSFQKMAWFANPFACVAAFTLLAMIPQLGREMGLSTAVVGMFCSIWFFARLAAFILMWQWSGWHYRFRFLLAGYILLIVGFASILTADGLLALGLGQVAFGLAVGTLYYASLFYSMDVGEARAEQGGVHEAMMGAGNFVGPAIGAVSLTLAPQIPDVGAISVSGLLAVGFLTLLGIRLKDSAR